MVLAAACTSSGEQRALPLDQDANFDWHLPPGFDAPSFPDSNPPTSEKRELGRRLFYDTRLSANGQGSCASCHKQRLAFTDARPRAAGVTGEFHARSSMSLVNVAYNRSYTWASRDLTALEDQIRIPLFNQDPVELGFGGREDAVLAELNSDAAYATQFKQSFPDSADPVSTENIIKALATFVRSIIAAESAFDRLLYLDDQDAMSAEAIRGMRLFFSDSLKCSSCHERQNLAGGQLTLNAAEQETEFHNTGLYNVGGSNRYPQHDSGLRAESGLLDDEGKFRAPSLRNVALTAPYMHDGSVATLSDVIDHYAAGGRTIKDGPNAGIGSENANKSPLLSGFQLSASEKADLISFLHSLTDHAVLVDPRFSNPNLPARRQ